MRWYFALLYLICLPCNFAFAKQKRQDEIEYHVKIPTRLPTDILEMINNTALLYTQEKRPLRSIAALYFRAGQDIPKIEEILKAFGYLDAKVNIQITRKTDGIFDVFIQIKLGTLYTLKSFQLKNVTEAKTNPLDVISLNQMGVQLHSPANAYTILAAQTQLIQELGHIGYPFAKITNKEYIADQKQHTVSVILEIDPGDFGLFGKTTITGLEKVKERFARYLISWEEGKSYDNYLIRQTQNIYFDSNLFSYVNITHPDHLDEHGLLPMHINVKESKFRSFFVGVNWSTQDEYGGSIGWEHRNIRGLGRKLSFKADVNRKTQLFAIFYRIPDLDKKERYTTYRLEQTLVDYIPYEAKTTSFRRRIDTIFRNFKNSWGFQVEFLRSKTPGTSNRYWLFSLPVSLRYNTDRNLIDQTRGQIFELGLVPTYDAARGKIYYLKSNFSYSLFIPITPSHRNVLALRAYFGSIIGQSLNLIPPPKRFYAGTEEFLRGYDYLTVSPLNSQRHPIGGRSMMMYNAELRFKNVNDFGFVLFYDLGQVYLKPYPNFKEGLLYSVGFGIRYFTLAGPISIDFAFPLKRRPPNFESKILKIYVSIGQTF